MYMPEMFTVMAEKIPVVTAAEKSLSKDQAFMLQAIAL